MISFFLSERIVVAPPPPPLPLPPPAGSSVNSPKHPRGIRSLDASRTCLTAPACFTFAGDTCGLDAGSLRCSPLSLSHESQTRLWGLILSWNTNDGFRGRRQRLLPPPGPCRPRQKRREAPSVPREPESYATLRYRAWLRVPRTRGKVFVFCRFSALSILCVNVPFCLWRSTHFRPPIDDVRPHFSGVLNVCR